MRGTHIFFFEWNQDVLDLSWFYWTWLSHQCLLLPTCACPSFSLFTYMAAYLYIFLPSTLVCVLKLRARTQRFDSETGGRKTGTACMVMFAEVEPTKETQLVSLTFCTCLERKYFCQPGSLDICFKTTSHKFRDGKTALGNKLIISYYSQ